MNDLELVLAVSAAATSIATVALVVVTHRYVRLTRELVSQPARVSLELSLEVVDGRLAFVLANLGHGAALRLLGRLTLYTLRPDTPDLESGIEAAYLAPGGRLGIDVPPGSTRRAEGMSLEELAATFNLAEFSGRYEIEDPLSGRSSEEVTRPLHIAGAVPSTRWRPAPSQSSGS